MIAAAAQNSKATASRRFRLSHLPKRTAADRRPARRGVRGYREAASPGRRRFAGTHLRYGDGNTRNRSAVRYVDKAGGAGVGQSCLAGCSSSRRSGRGRCRCGSGRCSRRGRRHGASFGVPGIGTVEAGSLEDDTDAVELLAQRPLALRARGQSTVRERLDDVEGMAAILAGVRVRWHWCSSSWANERSRAAWADVPLAVAGPEC